MLYAFLKMGLDLRCAFADIVSKVTDPAGNEFTDNKADRDDYDNQKAEPDFQSQEIDECGQEMYSCAKKVRYCHDKSGRNRLHIILKPVDDISGMMTFAAVILLMEKYVE
jgi:hypothetical protein